MAIWTLLGIAVALAMDAFAVAIAAGMTMPTVTRRHVFRLAFHFGLFQFMMPIIGWLLGGQLKNWVHGYDSWVAFALLTAVGGKMVYDAWRRETSQPRSDPTRGAMLVTLSITTSLDALAVGASMALSGVSVWGPSVVIGLVAAALTAVGLGFGTRLGTRWEDWAEMAGGLLLIGIGVLSLL